MMPLEDIWENITAFYANYTTECWVVAGILVVWYCWRKIRKHFRFSIPVTRGEFGSVMASVAAVKEVVRGSCECILSDISPKIAVKIQKNKVAVRIKIKAIPGQNVQTLSQRIQQLTARNLQEQFGFEHIASVDILVRGFHGGRNKWQSLAPQFCELVPEEKSQPELVEKEEIPTPTEEGTAQSAPTNEEQ